MSDGGPLIEHVDALLRRLSPEGREQARRARQRRWQRARLIARRLLVAIAAILVAAAGWGAFVSPLGVEGVMLTVAAMIVALVAVPWLSRAPSPTPETLVRTDLARMPAQAEAWLAARRAALPRPARPIADAIGDRLAAIAPQLATLDPRAPAAAAIRKLIGEELPDLVSGYQRVPAALRPLSRNGTSPDTQLTEGLRTVQGELERMSGLLASGDLDALATQRRYLDIKYRDDAAR
ncbi:MAG TPA: hypothetical protein VNQ31_10940 [Sphingomonadaceae bacterium]|nr:hypothetical protein [Sphingomonadaceae bacterium]